MSSWVKEVKPMFSNEERELDRSRKELDRLMVSNELADQAIMAGIRQAKAAGRKRKRYASLFTAGAAAIILLFSVKGGSTMAEYFSSLPGLEKVMELVSGDRGLMAAAENEYIQKIGASAEHNGIKATLDSAIYDEQALILFYSYEAENKTADVYTADITLLDREGNKLPYQANHGTFWTADREDLHEIRFQLDDAADLPDELSLSMGFTVNDSRQSESVVLPFALDKEKLAEKKVYSLNKTVTVEGQKMTVKDVSIYPSQTAVSIAFDPDNTKKIFGFNDLHIADENGGKWKANHVKDEKVNDNETVIYLESSYFADPKELYLRFNSIRALDKDELIVRVNPSDNKIIKAPKDGKLKSASVFKDELQLKLEAPFSFLDTMIFMHAADLEGRTIGEGLPFGAGGSPVDKEITYYVPYPKEEASEQDILLELLDYPASINGNAEIKLK